MVGQWYDSEAIASWGQRFRASLINSISGYKPANLIGTDDATSGENLAIMSSVVHLGAAPPLLGLVIRPDSADRHTLRNIRSSACYTINHVASGYFKAAHQTAARYPDEVSEFDAVGLTPQRLWGFAAPFVAEAPIKIGLELRQEIPIELNGTHFIIGEVVHLFVGDSLVSDQGDLDLEKAGVVALSGLDRYYRTELIDKLPYAKPT